MKAIIQHIAHKFGYVIARIPDRTQRFDEDGLTTAHNHDFVNKSRFIAAYEAGKASGDMYPGRWRFHVALWAAEYAARLEGDFVECGVNNGSLSTAIMNYLTWEQMEKSFHLFDTWHGLDQTQVSRRETDLASGMWEDVYSPETFEQVKRNFAKFPRVQLYRGSVPSTLSQCKAEKLCYLSLDMNCAAPEVAAIEYFWDKLVTGAIVLLDDYGWNGPHIVQKEAMDAFAARHGRNILSLPTGQGLLIR